MREEPSSELIRNLTKVQAPARGGTKKLDGKFVVCTCRWIFIEEEVFSFRFVAADSFHVDVFSNALEHTYREMNGVCVHIRID